MTTVVLPNTTLAMIVRDEKKNPAGGIERFCHATLPYVEDAVILDTGSVDGTKQVLKKMQGQYGNLRVYHHEFEGYGASRNRSLSHVKTKRALILDADELILPQGYARMVKQMVEQPHTIVWRFPFIHLNEKGKTQSPEHNARLFTIKGVEYQRACWEYVDFRKVGCGNYSSKEYFNTPIFHFLPPGDGRELKNKDWYKKNIERKDPSKAFRESPARTRGFSKWRANNPLRNHVRLLKNLDKETALEWGYTCY